MNIWLKEGVNTRERTTRPDGSADELDAIKEAVDLDVLDGAKLALLSAAEMKANVDPFTSKVDEVAQATEILSKRGVGLLPEDLKHDDISEGEVEGECSLRLDK